MMFIVSLLIACNASVRSGDGEPPEWTPDALIPFVVEDADLESQCGTNMPPARESAHLAFFLREFAPLQIADGSRVHSVGRGLILYGGGGHNDLWLYDLSSMGYGREAPNANCPWFELDDSALPQAIDGGALAVRGDSVFFIGGTNGSSTSSVVYEADIEDLASGFSSSSTLGPLSYEGVVYADPYCNHYDQPYNYYCTLYEEDENGNLVVVGTEVGFQDCDGVVWGFTECACVNDEYISLSCTEDPWCTDNDDRKIVTETAPGLHSFGIAGVPSDTAWIRLYGGATGCSGSCPDWADVRSLYRPDDPNIVAGPSEGGSSLWAFHAGTRLALSSAGSHSGTTYHLFDGHEPSTWDAAFGLTDAAAVTVGPLYDFGDRKFVDSSLDYVVGGHGHQDVYPVIYHSAESVVDPLPPLCTPGEIYEPVGSQTVWDEGPGNGSPNSTKLPDNGWILQVAADGPGLTTLAVTDNELGTARTLAAAAPIGGSAMAIVGGRLHAGGYNASTLDLELGTSQHLVVLPGGGGAEVFNVSNFVDNVPRRRASAAYDPVTNDVYYFGGTTDNSAGTANKMMRINSMVGANANENSSFEIADAEISLELDENGGTAEWATAGIAARVVHRCTNPQNDNYGSDSTLQRPDDNDCFADHIVLFVAGDYLPTTPVERQDLEGVEFLYVGSEQGAQIPDQRQAGVEMSVRRFWEFDTALSGNDSDLSYAIELQLPMAVPNEGTFVVRFDGKDLSPPSATVTEPYDVTDRDVAEGYTREMGAGLADGYVMPKGFPFQVTNEFPVDFDDDPEVQVWDAAFARYEIDEKTMRAPETRIVLGPSVSDYTAFAPGMIGVCRTDFFDMLDAGPEGSCWDRAPGRSYMFPHEWSVVAFPQLNAIAQPISAQHGTRLFLWAPLGMDDSDAANYGNTQLVGDFDFLVDHLSAGQVGFDAAAVGDVNIILTPRTTAGCIGGVAYAPGLIEISAFKPDSTALSCYTGDLEEVVVHEMAHNYFDPSTLKRCFILNPDPYAADPTDLDHSWCRDETWMMEAMPTYLSNLRHVGDGQMRTSTVKMMFDLVGHSGPSSEELGCQDLSSGANCDVAGMGTEYTDTKDYGLGSFVLSHVHEISRTDIGLELFGQPMMTLFMQQRPWTANSKPIESDRVRAMVGLATRQQAADGTVYGELIGQGSVGIPLLGFTESSTQPPYDAAAEELHVRVEQIQVNAFGWGPFSTVPYYIGSARVPEGNPAWMLPAFATRIVADADDYERPDNIRWRSGTPQAPRLMSGGHDEVVLGANPSLPPGVPPVPADIALYGSETLLGENTPNYVQKDNSYPARGMFELWKRACDGPCPIDFDGDGSDDARQDPVTKQIYDGSDCDVSDPTIYPFGPDVTGPWTPGSVPDQNCDGWHDGWF